MRPSALSAAVFSALFASGCLSASAHAADNDSLSAEVLSQEQQEAVKQLVREYLLENPEILIEMSKILEEDRNKAQDKIVSEITETVLKDPAFPAYGPEDSGHYIIEFFDYNCGYCKASRPMTEKLAKEYNMRTVYVEMPVLSPISQKASAIGLALYQTDKEKYFAYNSYLMGKKERLTSDQQIKDALKAVGSDYDELTDYLRRDDTAVRDALNKNMEMAAVLGIQGVPLLIIDGHIMRGAVRNYEDLESLVKTDE